MLFNKYFFQASLHVYLNMQGGFFMKIRDNFLWGGATAANQYEGAYLDY